MKTVPYDSTVGSLMYALFCNRPDIYYVVDIVSRYQYNFRPEYQTAMKYIFKYSKRIRDYMLTYGGSNLIIVGYTYLDFTSNMFSRKVNFRLCVHSWGSNYQLEEYNTTVYCLLNN